MDGLHQTLIGIGHAIRDLTCELKHRNDNRSILQRIEQAERNIMATIQEFSVQQKAFNTRQAAAIDSAVASVTGLTDDIAKLNQNIQDLQSSPGAITIEDQATLDELSVQGEAVAAKSEALASALKTLDDQTPPKPPVV